MKTFPLLILASFASFNLISCSDDDTSITEEVTTSKQTVTLFAPQRADYTTNPPTITGDYILFNFATGLTTTSTTDWDIAFRGTTILINGGEKVTDDEPERTGNGGAYIATGTLASISTVDPSLFMDDNATTGLAITKGSGNGWYVYDSNTHFISPIAGKILLIRTRDGKYAKLEITSYYQDGTPNDDLSNSQYYTFNYVYQAEDGKTSF